MNGDSCFAIPNFGSTPLQNDNEDDAYLAKELNALSVEEREKVFEELHGVNEIREESPDFVSERIRAIKAELAKYSVTKRRAFDRAVFLKPGLEEDEKLYLLFLRAERFDAIAAARKLCLHFEHKLELFGEAKLPKRITLEDMDEDDLAVFRTGSYRILSKKDRSGRTVGIIDLPRIKYKHWKNQVRYTWYNIFNILLPDEDTQKNGTVDILYFVDMAKVPENMLEYVRDSHHILSAFPCRPCGSHICYNNQLVRPFLSFLHMVIPKDRRLRERMHFGSHMEVQYSLCTFGVEIGNNLEEESLRAKLDKFLKTRREIEAKQKYDVLEREKTSGRIAHPSDKDVLCGRGRPYQDFPGNLRVGQIVDEHVPLYIETHERLAKTMIAIEIVHQVQTSGGRFLSRREDGWEIADDKVARGKISQALRVRALKKIRGVGCEPEPINIEPTPKTTTAREVKRRRFALEQGRIVI